MTGTGIVFAASNSRNQLSSLVKPASMGFLRPANLHASSTKAYSRMENIRTLKNGDKYSVGLSRFVADTLMRQLVERATAVTFQRESGTIRPSIFVRHYNQIGKAFNFPMVRDMNDSRTKNGRRRNPRRK